MNHPKQHTLWLLAAIAAPIAHFSGSGWLTGAITALLVLPLTLLPRHWELPKPIAILQILWFGVVAGDLLPGSAAYWPSDNLIVVPLTILALAALTDHHAAPRIGAVLALCMALLSVPVWISAASRIEPEWLTPTLKPWSPGLTLTLLLPMLPAAGTEQRGRRATGAALLTIVLCALVQGTVGSIEAEDPFYQTARTLSHMEPVVASALTLGWYALTCFLLQNAGTIAKSSGLKPQTARILASASAAIAIFLPCKPNGTLVIAITVLLWLILPLHARPEGAPD